MQPLKVKYLRRQISNHISLFFTPEASSLFNSDRVRFLPLNEAIYLREKVVAIPYDIDSPVTPQEPYRVEFNGTELTVFNRLAPPEREGWHPMPDDSAPLWYRHDLGTMIPAWNLFGTLFHLLTFGEERDCDRRDSHGRFAAAFSPRASHGLLEVPVFNEAAATIVAALAGLHNERSVTDLNGLVKPPMLLPSHDCDILLGNDIWTQAVRAVRIILPLAKFSLPKIGNIWWIVRNAITPRKFYFDNVAGMVDIERCFGSISTFYLLNGRGGRFGARSRFSSVADAVKNVPPEWEIGMHYNYDTFLNDDRFAAQKAQLDELTGASIVSGRAHYLKFDPAKSLAFLRRHGILVDESAGYADRIGYRNGIAGCFRAYDVSEDKPLDIWEVPMTVMDAVLVRQYGAKAIKRFSQLLYHLSRVGGALSVVFHTGQFFNPEHKHMLGVYHKLLQEGRQAGVVCETARSLVGRLNT